MGLLNNCVRVMRTQLLKEVKKSLKICRLLYKVHTYICIGCCLHVDCCIANLYVDIQSTILVVIGAILV